MEEGWDGDDHLEPSGLMGCVVWSFTVVGLVVILVWLIVTLVHDLT